MATRKDRKSKTETRAKQSKVKLAGECAFPSEQERLPLQIPGTYQVAMGTGEEILTWLRKIPRNTRAILIPFSSEASYKIYGPIFWHVAQKLPEIVARNQRHRFEQLVDALTQLSVTLPRAVSVAVPGARVTPAKGPLPKRRRRYAD